MMRSGIYKIGDAFYRLRYRDLGFIHKEDLGLWRADKVEWTGCHWRIADDDDYLIDDERRVVARESGWCLRREMMR